MPQPQKKSLSHMRWNTLRPSEDVRNPILINTMPVGLSKSVRESAQHQFYPAGSKVGRREMNLEPTPCLRHRAL